MSCLLICATRRLRTSEAHAVLFIPLVACSTSLSFPLRVRRDQRETTLEYTQTSCQNVPAHLWLKCCIMFYQQEVGFVAMGHGQQNIRTVVRSSISDMDQPGSTILFFDLLLFLFIFFQLCLFFGMDAPQRAPPPPSTTLRAFSAVLFPRAGKAVRHI